MKTVLDVEEIQQPLATHGNPLQPLATLGNVQALFNKEDEARIQALYTFLVRRASVTVY